MSRALPIVLALTVFAWACQQQETQTGDTEMAGMDTAAEMAAPTTPEPSPDSPEAKIANAESAAPADIAKNATIMDWPAEEGGEMTQLRAGTNGWTCFPSTPAAIGSQEEDPMCLDGEWLKFAQALMSKTQPSVSTVGIGYMLQGDRGASNIDPYATEPTPDNQWVRAGPHLMVITPSRAAMEAIPTDPNTGGPWIMWKGTPYAHVMVPVESPAVR